MSYILFILSVIFSIVWFWTCLLHLSGAQSGIQFTKEPTDVAAYEHDNVYVPCYTNTTFLPSWRINGEDYSSTIGLPSTFFLNSTHLIIPNIPMHLNGTTVQCFFLQIVPSVGIIRTSSAVGINTVKGRADFRVSFMLTYMYYTTVIHLFLSSKFACKKNHFRSMCSFEILFGNLHCIVILVKIIFVCFVHTKIFLQQKKWIIVTCFWRYFFVCLLRLLYLRNWWSVLSMQTLQYLPRLSYFTYNKLVYLQIEVGMHVFVVTYTVSMNQDLGRSYIMLTLL